MGDGKGSCLRGSKVLPVLLQLQFVLVLTASRNLAALAAESPTSVTVSTEQELVTAITDNSIAAVRLTVNLRLAAQAWPAVPILRTANFTVVGEGFYPILDLAFIESKIKLQPGVVFAFKQLELRNTRMRSGFEVDVFTASPGATVRFEGMVLHSFSCLPVDTIRLLMIEAQPATLAPNISWAVWCRTQPLLRACYNNTLQIWSGSSRLPESGLAGVTLGGGYILEGFDMFFTCEDPVLEECGVSQGFDYCVRTKIQSMFDRDDTWDILAGLTQPHPQPPPPSVAPPRGVGRSALGAIVGGVLGGTAFLVVIMVATVAFWRWRRLQLGCSEAADAAAKAGARTASAVNAAPNLPSDHARALQPDLEGGGKGACGFPATASGTRPDCDAQLSGVTTVPTAAPQPLPLLQSRSPPRHHHHHHQQQQSTASNGAPLRSSSSVTNPSSVREYHGQHSAEAAVNEAAVSITTLGESLPKLSSMESQDPRAVEGNVGAAAVSMATAAPDTADKPVVVVAGIHIELASVIGTGSFGKVFRGVWQGQAVAVKVLQYGAELCRAVHNEVLLSQTLRHPNLVLSLYFVQVLPGGRLGLHTSGNAGGSDATAAANPAAPFAAAPANCRPEQARAPPDMKPHQASLQRYPGPQLCRDPLVPPVSDQDQARASLPASCNISNAAHAASYSRFIISGAPVCIMDTEDTIAAAPSVGDGRDAAAPPALQPPLPPSSIGMRVLIDGSPRTVDTVTSAFLTGMSSAAASRGAMPLSASQGAWKGTTGYHTAGHSQDKPPVRPSADGFATATATATTIGSTPDVMDAGQQQPSYTEVRAPCVAAPTQSPSARGPLSLLAPASQPHPPQSPRSGAQEGGYPEVPSEAPRNGQHVRQGMVPEVGGMGPLPETEPSASSTSSVSTSLLGMPDPEALAALAAALDGDGSSNGATRDEGGNDDGFDRSEPDVLSRWDEQRRRQAQVEQAGAALQLIGAALVITPNGYVTKKEEPPAAGLDPSAAAGESPSPIPTAPRSDETAVGAGGVSASGHNNTSITAVASGAVGSKVAPAGASPEAAAGAASAALPLEELWLAAHTQPMEGSSHGFLVMELCEGGSAFAWRSTHWSKPEERPDLSVILKLALDIAYGMSYIHSMGVCHGDLKLSNVLLARSSDIAAAGGSPNDLFAGWVAKVCDFGLSRVLTGDRTHVSTRPYGTPTHMAPELWTKGHMSQPADVYAFGVTLWELATGDRPYKGMNAARILHHVLLNGGRPALPMWLPPSYTRLVTSCWAQSPKDRPTFTEIVRHLEAMLAVLAAVTPR